jgi:flagellar hook-basal body complex protein FliE
MNFFFGFANVLPNILEEMNKEIQKSSQETRSFLVNEVLT